MLTDQPPRSVSNSSLFPLQGSSSCEHDPAFVLSGYNLRLLPICGLCELIQLWEDEVPRRIHAYKLLAENGNPEITPQFWGHYSASLGLVPPKPQQNLRVYRLARGQLYGKPPSKLQYPLLAALWTMMGKQPKLAQALLGALRSRTLLQIAVDTNLSPFGANEAITKGIRMAFREIRSYR